MKKPSNTLKLILIFCFTIGAIYYFRPKPIVDMKDKNYGAYVRRDSDELLIHSLETEDIELNQLIAERQTQDIQESTKILDYKSKLYNNRYASITFLQIDEENITLHQSYLLYDIQEKRLAKLSDFYNASALRWLTHQNRKEHPFEEGSWNDYLDKTDINQAILGMNDEGLIINGTLYQDALNHHYLKATKNPDIPLVTLNTKSSDKMIAITFDDGPSRANTRKIMDTLERYNGQGTFFVLGREAQNNRDILQEMFERNHQVASHTFSHRNLKKLDKEALLNEVSTTEKIIQEVSKNMDPVMIRPPYGSYNDDILKVTDRTFINWNVDIDDWEKDTASSICNAIVEMSKPNAIVLMHDIYSITAEGFDCAAERLHNEGYTFVSVDTLLKIKNGTIKQGAVYFSGN